MGPIPPILITKFAVFCGTWCAQQRLRGGAGGVLECGGVEAERGGGARARARRAAAERPSCRLAAGGLSTLAAGLDASAPTSGESAASRKIFSKMKDDFPGHRREY